jgi:hypothetical protein
MRRAIFLLSVMVLVGCGTTIPNPASRLEVNDTLRTACIQGGFANSDVQISALLAAVETDRMNTSGSNSTEAFSYYANDCHAETPCLACMRAIVAQVYGQ